MIILDWIRNILGNNKKNTTIYTKSLVKKFGEKDQLEIALFDADTPLAGKDIIINVNGRDYTRVTDDSGVARLNINLQHGYYPVFVTFPGDTVYNSNTAHTSVTVQTDTRIEGTDIDKVFGDSTPYQCAVYSNKGRVAGEVLISINGVTYTRTPDSEGLYKLNINLQPGNYKLIAKFQGNNIFLPSIVENTIVIREPPAPEPEPVKLYSYITTPGGGKLGQTNGYRCGPHSLMQCIYRLTGIELSEATLASVCGTTSSGTSHQGLETGLAWFNKKYGYNLKITWKNKSELTWDEIQQAINNGALFFHLLYKIWGHYEVIRSVGDTLTILNSLGSYCSYPAYCGYIENRSKSTQQSYINGISQKSVCIITR